MFFLKPVSYTHLATKLGVFSTGPAIRSYGANFLCEAIGTFMLMFLIWVIFNANNGQLPAGFGPYLVGMLIWALGLSLGGPTGYAINPARDLGPRIAHAILPIPGKGSSDSVSYTHLDVYKRQNIHIVEMHY